MSYSLVYPGWSKNLSFILRAWGRADPMLCSSDVTSSPTLETSFPYYQMLWILIAHDQSMTLDTVGSCVFLDSISSLVFEALLSPASPTFLIFLPISHVDSFPLHLLVILFPAYCPSSMPCDVQTLAGFLFLRVLQALQFQHDPK